jgi:Tfp pilus assembly protein PilX
MTTMLSNRGIALVTTLTILAVIGALVLGLILTTQAEMAVSRNDATSAQAQYVAQAGLQTYKAALFQTFRRLEAGGSSGSNTDACRNSLSGGIDFLRGGAATTHTWVNNRIVVPQGQVTDAQGNAIGTYNVTLLRDPTNENRITVVSVGRTVVGGQARQATATARATFLIRNSSTLEQAVFAGTGSGMRFLNGNTTIYGGLYVVGDLANPDATVIQSNGNFQIFNHYDKSSGTGDFLTAAGQRSNNLCAAVRVQSGRIAIGGSTQLGTPENRLLAVAVGRGLADIDTSRGGTLECLDNKGVCSESRVGPFDIAEPPAFPRLDESPATEFCPAPRIWRTCIREEAAEHGLTLEARGGTVSILASSGATLPEACRTFLNNAAARADRTLVFGSTNIDCVAGGVGFRYTAANPAASFEVFGNINLRGLNVRFDRAVRYTATSRSGTGALQQFANFSVEAVGGSGGNFRTEASFTTNTLQKFPNNVLSIVAEQEVDLRGGNNTFITAPIYAGNTFRLTSNSVLFGQVIANTFCTTGPGGGGAGTCATAGSPAEIVFVPTGENRARSFRAIAPTGGLPTFTVLSYELR